MRRQAQKCAPLAAGLEDETEMPMLEVADATMNEARRPARGAAREVVAFDERGAQPSHRCVARNAGAVDTAADNENVELFGAEARETRGAFARGRGHRLFRVRCRCEHIELVHR